MVLPHSDHEVEPASSAGRRSAKDKGGVCGSGRHSSVGGLKGYQLGLSCERDQQAHRGRVDGQVS